MKKLGPAVAAAFVLGLVVGAVGGLGVAGDPFTSDRGPDPESPPYSMSTAGGNCLDVRPHAGWVHEVAVGDSFAVTLNATVVHDRDRTVTANVSRVTTGIYRIDLRTVTETETPDESRTKSPPRDCAVATDVRLATSLPTDYRRFEVAVNGRTLLTVGNEGTTGELFQLPNPVNATESAD